MAVLLTPPELQFLDYNGNPLSGGKIYTYTSGTLTPKSSFTDQGGLTPNTNPVLLDSSGRANIWIDGSYKIVITDSSDSIISTTDNISSFSTIADAITPYFESFSGNGTQTVYTLSDDVGAESKNIMVFVDSKLQEVTTNGDFATDTGWTKGIGWTIGSGVATATGGISTSIEQVSNVTLVSGQAYRITFTITRSAGGLKPLIGGRAGTERTGSGTYTEIIVASSSQDIKFTGNGFTGTLDNVFINAVTSEGYNLQNPSTYTVNGTSLTFSSAPPLGSNNIYVLAPSLLLGAASSAANNALVSETNAANSASAALVSETNAEASALSASLTVLNLSGTSTTSLPISVASKVFTTQSGKSFNDGVWILITSDADPTNFMHGQVTLYSGTSLTVNVTNIGGSGTFSDWTIQISGTRGATGATGATGGGLANIVDDLTPQLGGNLDANSFVITGMDASETTKGVVERATDAEVVTGTDTTRYITAKHLADNAGSSSRVLLSTQTIATDASIDFTTGIDGTYKNYEFELVDVTPTTTSTYLQLLMSIDGGTTWDNATNDYDRIAQSTDAYGATLSATGSYQANYIRITGNDLQVSNSSVGLNGTVTLFDPSSAGHYKYVYSSGAYFISLGLAMFQSAGVRLKDTSAVNGIRFIQNSGTLKAGTIRMYGII